MYLTWKVFFFPEQDPSFLCTAAGTVQERCALCIHIAGKLPFHYTRIHSSHTLKSPPNHKKVKLLSVSEHKNLEMVVFWFVTPCRLWGEYCPEDGGSMLLRNVGTHLQVHTASQFRRLPSITLLSWEPKTSYSQYVFWYLIVPWGYRQYVPPKHW
jgi:hypothetical protein